MIPVQGKAWPWMVMVAVADQLRARQTSGGKEIFMPFALQSNKKGLHLLKQMHDGLNACVPAKLTS